MIGHIVFRKLLSKCLYISKYFTWQMDRPTDQPPDKARYWEFQFQNKIIRYNRKKILLTKLLFFPIIDILIFLCICFMHVVLTVNWWCLMKSLHDRFYWVRDCHKSFSKALESIFNIQLFSITSSIRYLILTDFDFDLF